MKRAVIGMGLAIWLAGLPAWAADTAGADAAETERIRAIVKEVLR